MVKLLSHSIKDKIKWSPERIAKGNFESAFDYYAPASLFDVRWAGLRGPQQGIFLFGRRSIEGFVRQLTEDFRMRDGQFHRLEEDELGRPIALWTVEVTHWGTGKSTIVMLNQILFVSDGFLTGHRVDVNHQDLIKLAT